MVQVIYEEHEDEYWQKPLRDAIASIGNSWAGAIVRKQNYAADYAKSAANRAHETYLAQIGIKSREKISKNTLSAAKSRNETLSKQFDKSYAINQDREAREKNQWAYLKEQGVKEVDATGASQVILSSMNDLRVDKYGFIVTDKLSKDELAKQNAIMAKSPGVAEAYRPAVDQYFKRQKIISGRLQMLQILQGTKGNENAISRILNEPDQKIDILQLTGPKGSEQDARLQALGAQIRDDGTWANILASYKIDKVTADGLKSHEYKDLIRYSVVLGDNNLNPGVYAYKIGSIDQIGRTEGTWRAKESFSKIFPADHKDTTALLGAVNSIEGEAYTNVGQNTAEYVGAAIIDFMQKNAVYFTNPAKVSAAIRARVLKVAQAGPNAVTESYKEKITEGKNAGTTVTRLADKNLRDPINKAIHGLMFDTGDPEDKQKLAQDIMLQFIEGEGWHIGSKPSIRSVVTERPEGLKDTRIAKLFEGKSGSNIADSETTTITGSGDASVADSSGSFTLPGDSTATAAEPPAILTDNFANFTVKAGIKGGYLLDVLKAPAGREKMSGVADGKVTNGTVDLSLIPVADLNQIIFSGKTDTIEKKFWTTKLKDMRAVADPVPVDIFQDPNALQKIADDANQTYRNLKELYDTNAVIGQQQIMLPKYRDILFGKTGQLKGWAANVLPSTDDPKVGTKADVLMDWDYIEGKLGKNSSDIKQYEAIFEAMGISKTERDDGSYFGVGNRLRRLALMMTGK